MVKNQSATSTERVNSNSVESSRYGTRDMPKPKTSTTLLESYLLVLSLFVLITSEWAVRAQSLPPARNDGFFYSGNRVDPDAVLIEAFFDPVCPDSRDSWPPLKQAVEPYGSRVSLVVHLLPLPSVVLFPAVVFSVHPDYHDNAFAASRALHIVNALNTNATFRLLDWFFQYQERFYNAQTRNLSRTAVINEMIKFATEGLGNSYSSYIKAGFSDRKTDLKTRVSFKYSASRSVFGTPTFYINGFALPDASVPTDDKGWRSLIGSLISQQGKQSQNTMYYY